MCEDLIAAIQCALDVEENCRGLGQKRGIHCIHFSDKPDLHSTPIGPKAHRAARGVSNESYHYHHMDKKSINMIEVFVEGAENARDKFLPTSIIQTLNAAVDLLQCKLFGGTRSNGVAMNKNGIYNIHVDGDATYSIVAVLKSDHSCS